MGRLRETAINVAPLRESRTLRYLWLGSTISSVGTRLTGVAMAWQVYDLTRSKAQTGLLGLCLGIPYLLLSMYGGVMADRLDRGRILRTAAVAGGALSFLLALNATRAQPAVWPIFVLATLKTISAALSGPARMSLAPLLVRTELIPAAAALDQVSYQLAFVGGPGLAGLLIAKAGVEWTYLIDAITFGGSFVMLVLAGRLPHPPARSVRPLAAIREGFAFLRGRPPLQASFAADVIAMIFGFPSALLPAVAAARYHDNSITLGFLYAGVPLGMLLAALTSGWTSRVVKSGWGVIGAVTLWGLAITLFAFTQPFWLAMVALGLAGVGDSISGVFRMSILQTGTPPAMLGRLMGIGMAVWAAGPALGDAEAGLVAELTSTRFSIAFGGLACVAGIAALAFAWPSFRRYDIRTARAEAERAATAAAPAGAASVTAPA